MSCSQRVRPPLRAAALLSVLALTLAACSDDPNQDALAELEPVPAPMDVDPDPIQLQSPAEEADLDAVHLPVNLTGLLSVDPQWDTPPQVHDGVFLAPGERDDRLVFNAVAADGTQLWTAERPLSCSGFAVTSAGDRSVAVLTDLADPGESDDSLVVTTATAYDLHTGEEIWGPVEVPGPHQGPGLVFAERGDGPLGDTGQRVGLDAATGERTRDGAHVVGEFFGTTVIAEAGALLASASGISEELWRKASPDIPTDPDAGGPVSPPTNRLPPGSALLGSPEDGYGLWDLTTGELLTEGLDDAMFDAMSETWVAVRGDQLSGVDTDGEELWHVDLGDDPTLLGAGGVMAYVMAGGEDLEIYNVVTGNTARVYDPLGEGETAIPLAFTQTGATAVDTGTELLLVTDVPGSAEDYVDEHDPFDAGP